MALQSPYCFGEAVNTTVEISQETQRSFLCQIEAQLYNSEIYHQAIAGLQTMLGGTIGTAQILVKAVGREAIRLAFQQFTKQHTDIVSIPSQEITSAKDEQPLTSSLSIVQKDSSAKVTEDFNQKSHATPVAFNKLEMTEKLSSPIPVLPSYTQASAKPKPIELAPTVDQAREEHLRRIGKELQQARQNRSLSVQQLHSQTLVPLHHIQALEIGCLDKLPEDVYVQSFIRKLGNALGVDGAAMAASLPVPDLVKSIMPSWYQAESTAGFNLNSVQLYFGYAAVVAGAVGGLGWLSQQSTSRVQVEPDSGLSSQAPLFHSAKGAEPTTTPGLKFGHKGITIGADMAPPERSF